MIIDFKDLIKIIGESGKKRKTIKIYYPETEKRKEGWREVEPYSLTTDIPPDGEYLVYDKDYISPGHIFNAYNIGSGEKDCHSFILGKIKDAQKTGRSFETTKKWEVKF